jgi:uncharacterized protein DUF349
MEMESADKATTEFDNSVTSEEQGSLAEQKDSNKDIATDKKVDSAKPEEQLATLDEMPAAPAGDQSEVKKKDSVKGKKHEASGPDKKDKVKVKVTDASKEEKKPTQTDAISSKPTDPEAKEGEDTIDIKEPTPETVSPTSDSEVNDTTEEARKKKTDQVESEKKQETDDSEDLAADAPKEAQGGDQAADEHDDFAGIDFSTYSREELVEVIKKLSKEDNPFNADKVLQQIAPVFNKLRDDERQKALKKFVAEGGSEEEFQYKPDELSLRFDANYKLIKDKKSKKFREQDIQRNKNLVLAEEVLAELREFVDSEESSSSFNQFKAIQQKWKDIGDVPAQNSRTLWANYNALIHRFYDQRSIYFELKELDRKKNYEAKLILCEKAEALEKVKNLREAIKGLNDLHHEFKHLGPVPQEVQEELWQRFKTASDKVYERRKVFVHELKAELNKNLVKKQELIEKIKDFTDFDSDRIKEWNEKTKELKELQNSWEAIGGLPKEKAREINREFWSSFKKFYSNKHKFFKKLDADRDANLVKKQELLEKAIALKDSEEWDKTANELKKLQMQWREIGPVPEKNRKKIYDEFKATCDYFFEKRRVGLKNSIGDYKNNLQKKIEINKQILKLKKDADSNLEEFNRLRKAFLEIGYVPKKNIASIKQEYQEAVEKYLNALTVLNVKEKTEISLEAEFSGLAASEHSEKELYHREQAVRRQINKLEDDIALWQNNLEFFADSKSTDKLKKDVNKKIESAVLQVDSLKRQLKMLRSM